MALLLTVPWIIGIPLEWGIGASGVAAVTTGRLGLRELRQSFTVMTGLLVGGCVVTQTSPVVRLGEWLLPSLTTAGVRVVLGASFAAAGLTLFRYAQVAAGRLRMFALLAALDRILVLACVLVLWAANLLSDSSMVGACAVSYGLSFLVGCLVSGIPSKGKLATSAHAIRMLARSGWRIAVTSGLQMLNYRLDVVILSALAGAAVTGFYSVAGSVASLMWYLPNSAATVLLAGLGRMEPDVAASRTAKTAGAVAALVTLAAAIAAAVARPVLTGLFGPAFESAYLPLVLLLPGVILLSFPKIINSYLITIGRPGVAVCGSLVGVISTISLDLVLIPRWSATGAAVASSVAYAFFALFMLVAFHRVARLDFRAYLPSLADLQTLRVYGKWRASRKKN
ncbi:MAG: polysaccharide biosynthesis C-terminal domain-containing protein [Armatimonadetes bacterium]|nr:polysaccharide biosynthesis C-terminal domain-containing protein [Armatimonadota bacterium]